MRLAYKDLTGGPWREFKPFGAPSSLSKRTPIAKQYGEITGLGNIIVATVRGNRITRRFIRFI